MDMIKERVLKASKIIDDKQGIDISVLDVQGLTTITDYLIITTGMSNRHVDALAKRVRRELSKEGVKLHHREGNEKDGWILLDFLDFVVHIFDKNQRIFYDLDHKWNDAKKINIDNYIKTI